MVFGYGDLALESLGRNKTALLAIIPSADDAGYLVGENHFGNVATSLASSCFSSSVVLLLLVVKFNVPILN